MQMVDFTFRLAGSQCLSFEDAYNLTFQLKCNVLSQARQGHQTVDMLTH